MAEICSIMCSLPQEVFVRGSREGRHWLQRQREGSVGGWQWACARLAPPFSPSLLLMPLRPLLSVASLFAPALFSHQFDMTALHLASQEGHDEVVGLLLGAGAHTNAVTKVKRTPPEARL